MTAFDQRQEQRHALEELREAQNNLRIARLQITSAVQLLEDLARSDLVHPNITWFLADTGQHIRQVQDELRVAVAGVDIDAPLPSAATV